MHHATIRDLQKQVTQIQRKISTVKNPNILALGQMVKMEPERELKNPV